MKGIAAPPCFPKLRTAISAKRTRSSLSRLNRPFQMLCFISSSMRVSASSRTPAQQHIFYLLPNSTSFHSYTRDSWKAAALGKSWRICTCLCRFFVFFLASFFRWHGSVSVMLPVSRGLQCLQRFCFLLIHAGTICIVASSPPVSASKAFRTP